MNELEEYRKNMDSMRTTVLLTEIRADRQERELNGAKAALDMNRTEIRSLQEKLAVKEGECDGLYRTLGVRHGEIAKLRREASESDAHASAIEEKCHAAFDVEAAAKELWDPSLPVGKSLSGITTILRKHFRAGPAVYVTDIEAVMKEFAGSKLLRRTITKHTRPISREALTKALDQAEDLGFRSGSLADAVLSFIGAGATGNDAL